MSVLSDLFQDIADAIGEKTGDPDKPLSPADFPSEILSIVTGTIIEGGGDGSNIHIAMGSFDAEGIGNGTVTVTHGLGTKPDFICVHSGTNGTSTLVDGNDNPTAISFVYGFNSKFKGINKLGAISVSTGDTRDGTMTIANWTFLVPDGMDETTDTGAIRTPDDTTFTVGGIPNVPFYQGWYHWFAIAGMGGPVAYPYAEEETF